MVMSKEQNGDYLWDKTGEPDPEVQRLESLLAPFAHDDRPFAARVRTRWGKIVSVAAAVGGRRWRWTIASAAAAAAFVTAFVIWQSDRNQLSLVNTTAGNEVLRTGDRLVTTTKAEILELEYGLSEITVDPGSILYVDRLNEEITHLRLERGRLHAFVGADARERFFQVQTPATNCVDLGCMYTLSVDDNKLTRVVVEMGRVAFEDGGREVVVPADATCLATKEHGAGTPRHLDTPDKVVEYLDEFDAEWGSGPKEVSARVRLARRVLALLAGGDDLKYSLIAWHFLQDPAPGVSAAAAKWLVENCPEQKPAGFAAPRGRVGERDRKSWRTNLEEFWGW
jgi:hypothetical protein